MKTAFERLIDRVPESSQVLDVGYGGLGGENTTNFLRARFKNVEGLCKQADAVEIYQAEHKATDKVYIGTYPEHMPDKRYDLLVLDMNIDGNLLFWSHGGMKQAWEYVHEGGYIISYVMLTDYYGREEETHEMIKKHRAGWWALSPEIPIVAQESEERRFYINWVLLKKP